MTRASALEQRLADGELIILDGAIGTELERLGAPMHEEVWCGHALETHPELVSEVHRSYIEAGADVITTNTYTTGRSALQMGGLEDKVLDWNRLAVKLAREARDAQSGGRPVSVAGSVATFGSWRKLSADQLRSSFAEQARILVDHGVDLIILETLASESDVVCAAIDETAGLGVPVWVAISCLQDRDSGKVMHGDQESQAHGTVAHAYEDLGGVVRRVMSHGGSAILTMHSDLNVMGAALAVMRESYDGPVGLYPNAGYWTKPNWAFVDQVTPEDYLACARDWAGAGARIIGGCCGIGPDHIRALRAGLFSSKDGSDR